MERPLNPVNGCLIPPSPTDKQVFDHLKCEVLESLRQTLTKSLLPDRHMDFLRSKHVLSEEDCEEIIHPPTRQKKASKFLDIMEKKGAEAYDALCEALRVEGTQTFLLTQLHENFELRQRRYRDLVGQQRSNQGLLNVSPPPLQPPPPPSYFRSHPLHQGQGHDLRPMEHAHPGFLNHHPSGWTSADSCPGYCASVPTDVRRCSGCVSLSTDGSCVTLTTDSAGKEERVKVVDLQKERLDVAKYLHSLPCRNDEPVNDAEPVSSPQPALTDLQPEAASLERLLPTFLSTTATVGSCSDSSDGSFTSLDPSASPLTLPAPTQVSQTPPATGEQAVVGRHQRLSSRGSLQEMGIALSSAGGNSAAPPLSAVPGNEPVEHEEASAHQSPEPVEDEDTSIEASSSPGNSSFFGSLDNESLAQSSSSQSGAGSSDAPILCSTALRDQHLALGKCRRAHNSRQEEGKENGEGGKAEDDCVRPKTLLASNSEQLTSPLSCVSSSHCTDRKTVVVHGDGKENVAAVPPPPPPPPALEEVKGKEGGERDEKEEFVFSGGISREMRDSLCNNSGCSPHATQC